MGWNGHSSSNTEKRSKGIAAASIASGVRSECARVQRTHRSGRRPEVSMNGRVASADGGASSAAGRGAAAPGGRGWDTAPAVGYRGKMSRQKRRQLQIEAELEKERERQAKLDMLKSIDEEEFSMAYIAAKLAQQPEMAESEHGVTKLLKALATTDGPAGAVEADQSRGGTHAIGTSLTPALPTPAPTNSAVRFFGEQVVNGSADNQTTKPRKPQRSRSRRQRLGSSGTDKRPRAGSRQGPRTSSRAGSRANSRASSRSGSRAKQRRQPGRVARRGAKVALDAEALGIRDTRGLTNLAQHFVRKLDNVLDDMAATNAALKGEEPPKTLRQLAQNEEDEQVLGRDMWSPDALPDKLRPKFRYELASDIKQELKEAKEHEKYLR